MLRRTFLSRMAGCGFIGGAGCCLTGCGTLMHSDRIDQPHNHEIDWKVAALDGLGLVLFFVPGVVAFAVDFYTGAIYLPPGTKGAYTKSDPVSDEPPTELSFQSPADSPSVRNASYSATPPSAEQRQVPQQQPQQQQLPPPRPDLGFKALERMKIPREELKRQQIEQLVANHVGHPVSLDDPQVRVSRLSRIDRFSHQCRQHQADGAFGHRIKAFFDGLHWV